jgi:hypothetical protein
MPRISGAVAGQQISPLLASASVGALGTALIGDGVFVSAVTA